MKKLKQGIGVGLLGAVLICHIGASEAKSPPLPVLYEHDARDAISLVHRARRQWLVKEQGRDEDFMDRMQKRWQKKDAESSFFINILPEGKLIGAIKKTGVWHQPWQIWMYNLHEKGRTSHVIVSDGGTKEAPAVLIRMIDAGGCEFSRIHVLPFDTHSEQLACTPRLLM